LTVTAAVLLLTSCQKEKVNNDSNTDPDNQQYPSTAHVIRKAVTDIDGNTYDAVQIGNQVWMAENLRTTRYADGTTIPLGTQGTVSPCRYAPGRGQNNEENATNVAHFGYLYNWAAVMHGDNSSLANPSGIQGICPSGWHVPSDAEWTELTDYVNSQSQYQCDSNIVNIAKSLSSNTDWESSSSHCAVGNDLTSNNSTDFSALPAGGYFVGTPIEDDFRGYKQFGESAFFWSATLYDSSNPIYRGLSYINANVAKSSYYASGGFSVRCIRN